MRKVPFSAPLNRKPDAAQQASADELWSLTLALVEERQALFAKSQSLGKAIYEGLPRLREVKDRHAEVWKNRHGELWHEELKKMVGARFLESPEFASQLYEAQLANFRLAAVERCWARKAGDLSTVNLAALAKEITTIHLEVAGVVLADILQPLIPTKRNTHRTPETYALNRYPNAEWEKRESDIDRAPIIEKMESVRECLPSRPNVHAQSTEAYRVVIRCLSSLTNEELLVRAEHAFEHETFQEAFLGRQPGKFKGARKLSFLLASIVLTSLDPTDRAGAESIGWRAIEETSKSLRSKASRIESLL